MVAPVLVPASTGKSQLANAYACKVRPLGAVAGAVTEKVIFGVSNFVPSTDFTTADNSDYDANGWGSDFTTQKKWSGTITLQSKLYTNAVDAGQAMLQGASDATTILTFTYFNRNLTVGDAYEVDVLVQWNPQGGGVTDLATTQVMLKGQGAPRVVTNPMGP